MTSCKTSGRLDNNFTISFANDISILKGNVDIMTKKFSMKIWDNSDDEAAGTFNFPAADATALTGAPPNDFDTLKTYVDALVIGTLGESVVITEEQHAVGSQARPASQLAQKENRFVISFTDDVTGKRYSRSIPTADLTVMPSGSESVDLTSGAGLDIKTWIDANGESELGNAVTVTSIRFAAV